MLRTAAAFVLSLLLLFLQWEAQVHPLSHLGERLRTSHEQAQFADAGTQACVSCTLIAGGCNAAVAADASPECVDRSTGSAIPRETLSAQRAPVYYLSRAPPSLA